MGFLYIRNVNKKQNPHNMIIEEVSKRNRHLPTYNYMLDTADYIINECIKQVKKAEDLWNIEAKLKQIEEQIRNATRSYNEKEEKTVVQCKGFIEKKETIKLFLKGIKTFP